jgi:TetR/AcrR family transcriptional regulator
MPSPARKARPVAEHQETSTRERILDAALGAFAEQGFDAASTRTIAARAGVNLGLIPYYFGGKQALWREAVDRAFSSLSEGVGEIGRGAGEIDSRAAAAVLIRRYVRFVARHPEFVLLMHEEGKRDSERMRWIVDRHVRPLFEATTRLMALNQGQGRIPAGIDPLHFHYILAGAVGLFFHQAPECRRLTDRDPFDEAMVEAHADAIVHLMVGKIDEEVGS